MNIEEALQSPDQDIRLTNDAKDRWLIWADFPAQWVVYEKKPYQRNTKELYAGDSGDEAVSILVGE